MAIRGAKIGVVEGAGNGVIFLLGAEAGGEKCRVSSEQ